MAKKPENWAKRAVPQNWRHYADELVKENRIYLSLNDWDFVDDPAADIFPRKRPDIKKDFVEYKWSELKSFFLHGKEIFPTAQDAEDYFKDPGAFPPERFGQKAAEQIEQAIDVLADDDMAQLMFDREELEKGYLVAVDSLAEKLPEKADEIALLRTQTLPRRIIDDFARDNVNKFSGVGSLKIKPFKGFGKVIKSADIEKTEEKCAKYVQALPENSVQRKIAEKYENDLYLWLLLSRMQECWYCRALDNFHLGLRDAMFEDSLETILARGKALKKEQWRTEGVKMMLDSSSEFSNPYLPHFETAREAMAEKVSKAIHYRLLRGFIRDGGIIIADEQRYDKESGSYLSVADCTPAVQYHVDADDATLRHEINHWADLFFGEEEGISQKRKDDVIKALAKDACHLMHVGTLIDKISNNIQHRKNWMNGLEAEDIQLCKRIRKLSGESGMSHRFLDWTRKQWHRAGVELNGYNKREILDPELGEFLKKFEKFAGLYKEYINFYDRKSDSGERLLFNELPTFMGDYAYHYDTSVVRLMLPNTYALVRENKHKTPQLRDDPEVAPSERYSRNREQGRMVDPNDRGGR